MFILIFEQLLKMFFIMVLAFVCFKIGLVDQTGNQTVSNLLLLVVNPVLIITGGFCLLSQRLLPPMSSAS